VRVLTVLYNAGSNSVTLVLASPKPGKPMQVAVSGLRGANGTAVASFVTNL
jgi:hypothetical protein